MKRFFVLGFLLVCTIAVQAQSYENPADLENYNRNWTHTYNDSMAASTTVDTLILGTTGKKFNTLITARGANIIYKLTKASIYQPHWIPLLQNESKSYAGTTEIDSIFFKTSSGTGAIIVEWSKF